MNLSKNFTLTEFTQSQTALRMGIDNTPNEEHLASARKLFENVVQAVRENFGPTVINSGYRGPKLNEAIGGSPKIPTLQRRSSGHPSSGVSNYEVAKYIETI